MTERPAINAVIEWAGGRTKDRRSYNTSCVLHEDRTPSMSVNTEKDVWKCQSCGQGGDSYSLIMAKEECSFGEARALATALGLAEGSSGGSDDDLRGSAYGSRRSGGRKASARKGDRSRYRPKILRGDGD